MSVWLSGYAGRPWALIWGLIVAAAVITVIGLVARGRGRR